MKISINGAEAEESSFQGETLKEVLDVILKSRRDSYVRRIWLEGQEVSSRPINFICKSSMGLTGSPRLF